MKGVIIITFGEKVLSIRTKIGMSQAELARKSGFRPSYICRIEKNTRSEKPDFELMQKIANALNVDISEFINMDNEIVITKEEYEQRGILKELNEMSEDELNALKTFLELINNRKG